MKIEQELDNINKLSENYYKTIWKYDELKKIYNNFTYKRNYGFDLK